MGLSHRLDIRIDPTQLAELDRFANANGLARAAGARVLIARGLISEGGGAADARATALAALVASEHAVLMVASVLPEGESRMRALAARASAAAEERLAMFVEPAAPGDRE